MEAQVKKNKHWIRDLFKACWGVLNFSRRVFVNIVFIIIALFFFAIMMASEDQITPVENNSVLKLTLSGVIVEQKSFVDPYQQVLDEAAGSSDKPNEILLTDILTTLDEAANDDRITGLVLDLHRLVGGGLSKLNEVADAIVKFKQTSQKPVIVYGDYFSQNQYFIAAHADQVILHPMGAISMEGYGRYSMYYKDALEKLKVSTHIFRVGTFKSAVEPYLRNDMSDAAKEANKQWMGDLWNDYKQTVAAQRNIDVNNFDETSAQYLEKLKQANGEFSKLALQQSWVDKLMTHQEFSTMLKQEVFNKNARYVSMGQYLANLITLPSDADKVAVVVARGVIYDGSRPTGEVGGDSTAKLLKQARKDKSVKAVVLRVDSPGGSAFASEIIRNEIEALKKAGKPVVASMSSVAASGGYWISASADEIWASPNTITGSIGIYGMLMTFEKSLEHLGIHTDGVGTTEMAGFSLTRQMQPEMAQVIQVAIEAGYQRFLSLVATEREMSIADVDKVAQGRVWSGKKAQQLGLVDNLGSFNDAIESAANLAELSDYQIDVVTKPLTPMEELMQSLLNSYVADMAADSAKPAPLKQMINSIYQQVNQYLQFNDPKGMYLHCIECTSL